MVNTTHTDSRPPSFVPTFGALPTLRRNPASIVVAVTVNLTILALAVALSFAAKKSIVLHNYNETVLTMPTLPPPVKFKLPPAPKVQPLKLEKASIEPPKLTIPRPVPELKPIPTAAPRPHFQASVRHVVLAPQVKHVQFGLAVAPKPRQQPQMIAAVHFGETTGARRNRAHGGVVATAFESGIESARNASSHGEVASAGFGDTAAAAGNHGSGHVASAGFGAEQRVSTTARAVPPPPPTTSLIILSKPPVAYTAAARARKIQGDVVLSVTFTASGHVIVHGVVRGLGYGLDQEASRVARGIRFRPALRDGHPVDVTTHIIITFQLA